MTAKPLQAAVASAASFAGGAALPLIVIAVAPPSGLGIGVGAAALVSLAALGGLAARVAGAKLMPGILRVVFWSALAMGVTYAVGAYFGAPA